MNYGLIKKIKCVRIIAQLQEQHSSDIKTPLLNVLDAVRLLPLGRSATRNVHSFAHRTKNPKLTELCLSFWNHSGEITEGEDGQWHWNMQSIIESKRSCEGHIRRCNLLNNYFNNNKIAFTEVADERKRLERSVSFAEEKHKEPLQEIVESLKKRQLKEAAFLYIGLDDECKKSLTESLDTFLSYIYEYNYSQVLVNEEYEIGHDAIDKLNKEEVDTLVNTVNIFLSRDNDFNRKNIHEVSNIGLQMALSKASSSVPTSIKEILESINTKLLDEATTEFAVVATASKMLIKAFPTEKQARQYIKNQYTRKSLIGNLGIMEVPKSRPPGNQMKGDIEVVKESIANTAGSGNVSGLTADDPIVKKKKKEKDRKKFAGRDIFEISEEDYIKCMPGKVKYERWSKIFNDDCEVGMDIKNYARKNPSTPFIIQSEKTGEMMFFTRHENMTRGKKK